MSERRCIAVASHKGGSGKTTVAVNVAGALAARGRRVIVVDGDPQGAATIGLGVVPAAPSLYDVLLGDVGASEAVVETAVAGLGVLPATIDLAGAEIDLPRRGAWQQALRRSLGPLTADVVIVDTPPGLGVLPYMALCTADQALIACPADFLSVRSLPTVLEGAKRAGVDLIGIVPTMLEGRTRHEADFARYLGDAYAGQLLTPVPRRVALRDALAAGEPINLYAPGSDAARAFETLGQEVLDAETT